MPFDSEAALKKHHARIRLLKKILRPMPRRSNLHRYPIIKWFASSARKRDYLWRFHRPEIVRALWLGWFIALIPIYGIQMICAFVGSFIFKANCLVAMAVQWVTNPITIPIILIIQYLIGDQILSIFFESPDLGRGAYEALKTGVGAFWEYIKGLNDAYIYKYVFSCVFLGGLFISAIGAAASIFFFDWYSKRHSLTMGVNKAKK